MKHTVLFVDDEPNVTDALKRALRREPYRILSARSAEEALAVLERERVDVIVSDEKMEGMSGSELLAMVRKRRPNTIRMILTGHASLDAAVRAINEGEIYRFFTKPCNETDLAVTIRQALRQNELMTEARRLLDATRNQAGVMDRLKKERPDLLKMDKDREGAIIVNETEEEMDLDKLINEISEQTKRIS